ncbi:hypothetical protein N0B51_03040 [Tsuneonella sp. YG55]|uniref:Uncharacterized protein n=1 Tax=Tsuneonella litorea TaxID=2976475 RepID=A0A9X2VYZ9_9SPHN|nr:hypothetical protein [Tsuneonella litorea]MCT2557952.1 hypothetical protein [Tsuneonella litorea]
MDVHWKSGDLALCIKHSRWRDRATGEYVDHGPRAGSVHVVRAVGQSDFPDAGMATTLLFAEWGGDQFAAYRFVRLDPGETTESHAASRVAVPIAIGVDG